MGALNTRQFSGHGEQLAMFMSPDEIVEKVHKLDSRFYGPHLTPREQWEHPESGYNGEQSLADDKMDDVFDGYGREHRESVARLDPVSISHERPFGENPVLTDGHHRLAYAQSERIPWLPVQHYRNGIPGENGERT